MRPSIITKLNQAQGQLNLNFPAPLFEFISTLNQEEVKFGEEEWLFWSVHDKPNDDADNFVLEHSRNFKNEWGLDGLVFATNGIGDYLVVLPNETADLILVMMHETAELKLFGKSIGDVLENGPHDYFWDDAFLYRIDENGQLVKSDSFRVDLLSDYSDAYFGEDYELRSQLDKYIDDEDTHQASVILAGLEKLSGSKARKHRVWALNKLSDLYFKGFGPVPRDFSKALFYNGQAIELSSHKAISNLAACHFFGLGMEKNLDKALELLTQANEMSKSNQFADIIANKEGGGMYDSLLAMIQKEIKKQKNKS